MAVAYRRSSVKFCTIKMSPLVFALLEVMFQPASGFYVPGVAPVEFKKGDRVDVRAVKMTSVITQLPYDYYSLPFCKPQVVEYKTENLGEVLRGDRIVNTPLNISMAVDQGCAGVCAMKTLSMESSKLIRERIKQGYSVHLIVDNLPVATRYILDGKTNYEHGFKLGYLKQGKTYIFNHLNLVMLYHTESPKAGEEQTYRVVGFEVETRSYSVDTMTFKDGKCSYNSKTAKPQEIIDGENKIQFTYQVTWHSSLTKWASRWDTYLKMTDVQIHWFSIINSVVVVLFLAAILAMIIIRTLRRDIARYNKDEEMDEAMEETGWKLVHGDVFRPPKYTRLLAAFVGAGIQIFMMTSILIVFAVLGMLSPSARGSLMTAAIFAYAFMGLIAGYVSGRLYKTMKGTQWKSAALQTAIIYPTFVFGAFFFLNFFLWGKQSSGALPFTTMLAILCTWLGISLPLVLLGYFFGFRKAPFSQPVRTNQIPRQVPEQEWYSNILILSLMSGLLPFGAMFIELFFIFSAIWENQFYYMFGFLFLVFVILVISCSQIAIVTTYVQLCSENYHWWWRSFISSGGSAFYVLGYSIFYFVSKLNISGFIPTLLYFTYTAVMVFTFWLLTATVGFFATFMFIRKIYAAIKID